MSLIWGGISFCLPTFMIGALPVPGLSWAGAFWVNVIGNAICAILIALAGYAGVASGLPAVVLWRRYFGSVIGGRLVPLAIFCSTCGWFGLLLAATSDGLFEMLPPGSPASHALLTVAIGAAMTITSMLGNSAILLVNRLSMPLLMLLIIYHFYHAVTDGTPYFDTAYLPTGETDFFTVLNLIIAGYIVGAICSSDFSRYAKDLRANWLGAIIGVFLVSLFLSYIGMYIKLATGQWNPLKAVYFAGSGPISVAIIVLSAWTTNHALLYSAALSLTSLAGASRPALYAVLAGCVGTAMALSEAASSLEGLLTWLSYLFPALLGLFLSHYFAVSRLLPGGAPGYAAVAALLSGSLLPLLLPEWAATMAGILIGAGVYTGWSWITDRQRRVRLKEFTMGNGRST